MYWSEDGRIGGADMDGENQKVVAVLTYYFSYDARGLAMDIQMNRIYFVSYWFEGLLYVDLNAGGKGNGPVQVLFMDYLSIMIISWIHEVLHSTTSMCTGMSTGMRRCTGLIRQVLMAILLWWLQECLVLEEWQSLKENQMQVVSDNTLPIIVT